MKNAQCKNSWSQFLDSYQAIKKASQNPETRILTGLWRRVWDSNPRTGSTPIKRFRVVLVMTTSITLHIHFLGSHFAIRVQECKNSTQELSKFSFCEPTESIENTGKVRDKMCDVNYISSQARYDHFDTCPYDCRRAARIGLNKDTTRRAVCQEKGPGVPPRGAGPFPYALRKLISDSFSASPARRRASSAACRRSGRRRPRCPRSPASRAPCPRSAES